MKFLKRFLAAAAGLFIGVAIFERVAPRSLVKQYWRVVNPIFLYIARVAPDMVIIETVGRRTGRRHKIPVTCRSEDDTLWVVAAHAREADYVRNIRAHPQVRMQMRHGWRTGTAYVLTEDDARKRALWINPVNGLFLRIASDDLVTVRINLKSS